jgi:hypothetical protein
MTTVTVPVHAGFTTTFDDLVLAGTRAIERAIARRVARRAATAARNAYQDAAIERARDAAAMRHSGILPR